MEALYTLNSPPVVSFSLWGSDCVLGLRCKSLGVLNPVVLEPRKRLRTSKYGISLHDLL